MGNDGNARGQAWEERRAHAASFDAPIGRLAFPGAALAPTAIGRRNFDSEEPGAGPGVPQCGPVVSWRRDPPNRYCTRGVCRVANSLCRALVKHMMRKANVAEREFR